MKTAEITETHDRRSDFSHEAPYTRAVFVSYPGRPGLRAGNSRSSHLDLLARARRSLHSRPRWIRELIGFGLALLVGILLIPPLIWVIGNRLLGPYTHGQDTRAGSLALFSDFLSGLGRGSAVYWLVACGPVVFLLFLRLSFALLRPPASPD